MAGYVTNLLLLALLVFILVLVIRTRRLFPVVVLAGAYSLVSAAMFVNLDAVDVAFTEAAVGAGISTVLFLAAMAYLPGIEKTPPEAKGIGHILPALIICIIAGVLLVAAAVELPPVGDPTAPPHVHVAPRYLEESGSFLHIPNVVTTVLASYRGFDTFGEVVVVFTAGLGVLVLLAGFTRTARIAKSGKTGIDGGEGDDA
jgi:multicomponent Na+:H+ antiporter subunit B